MSISSISDSFGKNTTFTEKATKLHEELLKNELGLSYLEKRGLSTDTIKNFMLGYDVDRKAISIPHFKRSDVVAIKYRFIEGETRYASEKGGQHWVFNENGIDVGRNKGGLLVTEGEFDCMAAWQAGFKNVISSNGADATGTWVELLQTIPKIYIAFDNDEAGKSGAKKFSQRLGTDKCFEVETKSKDLSEYFTTKGAEDFKDLIRDAKPFYRYQFTGVTDLIDILRSKKPEYISSKFVPGVHMEKDWLVSVLADTGVGKTSYVLNIADELTSMGVPTLVFPFEGGIEFVGKRFLQVKFDKTQEDFRYTNDNEWDEIIEKCNKTPIFFSTPEKGKVMETMNKAKMLFDVQVVIVDHLDYLVRHVQGNRAEEIANTLQSFKTFALDNKVLMIVVSHIKRTESGSGLKRKTGLHDAKGSSSIEQDSQVVIALERPSETELEVNVLKNKGPIRNGAYEMKNQTGKIVREITTEFHD